MEHCKWNPSIEQCCGKSSSSAVSRCYLDWLKTVGFIIVWSVVCTHLRTVEIDVSPFHVSLTNIFEPLPRGPLITHSQTELSWIIHPMQVTGQRLPVNIAPPTGGEISIFRSLWMKFCGVTIHLIKRIQQKLLLLRIWLYLVLIRCVSNFWMSCSFFFFSKSWESSSRAGKRGVFSEEEILESKRPRVSPVPFSGGLGQGSEISTQF